MEVAAKLMPVRRVPGPRRSHPQDGEPRCLQEQILQHLARHKLTWYIAVVVTLSLALQLGVDGDLHRLLWGGP